MQYIQALSIVRFQAQYSKRINVLPVTEEQFTSTINAVRNSTPAVLKITLLKTEEAEFISIPKAPHWNWACLHSQAIAQVTEEQFIQAP